MSGRQTCLDGPYLCPMQAETSVHSVKEQIISTATRLFLHQGYNLTGVNQIIEEAGIAKASLYYHFPSKEDLGVAYLRRRSETWFNGLEEYLRGAKNARECLIKTFEYRGIFIQQNNFAGCSYTRIMSELPQQGTKLHNQAISSKERQRKFFLEIVQQIDSVAEVKKTDLANMVFLLYDGATMQCQVYRETGPMEIARKAVIELLDCYPRL
jgi:AcrR family transcriptional regulator